MNFLGAYYIDTPFSLVFTHQHKKHGARDTFIHESRHNIYNGLGLSDGADVAFIVKSIKKAITFANMLAEVEAPTFIVQQQLGHLVEKVNDIGVNHIRENKDEILANFDRLVR